MKYFELVGVAGTGKSTVTKLVKKKFDTDVVTRLKIRVGYDYLLILSSLCCVIKTLGLEVCYYKPNELRLFLWLINSCKKIRRLKKSKKNGVVLFDQGLIYVATILYQYGQKQGKEKWLNIVIKMVAEVIDGVIYLDAKNSVLIKRIRKRNVEHRVKYEDEKTIEGFLSLYRENYKKLIKKVNGEKCITVVEIDTEKNSSEQVLVMVEGILSLNEN